MKRVLNLLTIAGLSLSLSGCVFVAGAAAGAATIAVVYDHRTLTNTFKDTHIANQIVRKIRVNQHLSQDSHVEVSVFHRVVLLTGETPDPRWRHEAGELASNTPGVTKVYNQISVEGPTSTLTHTSDSWITAKIKGLMLTNSELRTGSIKVVTENGVVYLMGSVTHTQSNIAVNISRQVSGVQKVVKIFQYKR